MNPPKRMCTDRNGGTDEGSQEKGETDVPASTRANVNSHCSVYNLMAGCGHEDS